MIRELPAGKTRLVTPYRIGVSVLLAGAFAALYVAFVSAKDPEPSTTQPAAVVSFEPADGSTVLRQSRIVAQLRSGLVGVLVVDGTEIPEDQLEHLEGSNWVGFTPGPGTEIGALKPGQRCATVVYWEPAAGRRTAERFRWCWQVH
jgi:hypothetical protein